MVLNINDTRVLVVLVRKTCILLYLIHGPRPVFSILEVRPVYAAHVATLLPRPTCIHEQQHVVILLRTKRGLQPLDYNHIW